MNRRQGVIFVVLSLLSLWVSAGCQNRYSMLNAESAVEPLAGLQASAAAFGNHTYLYDTERAGEPTFRLAVHETGVPSSRRALAMVHGVFADFECWRYLVGDLGYHEEMWLIDLPGCGESDKPNPKDLREDGYSPLAMGERMLQALRGSLEARSDEFSLVIIAHSLGGAVTIQALTDPLLRLEYGDVVDRIEAVVLLSPLDVALEKPIPMFQEIAEMGAVKVDLSDALGIMHDRVGEAVLNSVVDPALATKEEANKRIQVLRDPARRRAMQAMLKQTTPWEADKTPDWDALQQSLDGYCTFPARCLIMWGRRDEILPVSMGYKLAIELGAMLVIFEQSKHSIHVDAAVEATRMIKQFLDEGVVRTSDADVERYEIIDLSQVAPRSFASPAR